jgi:hypothetical protein
MFDMEDDQKKEAVELFIKALHSAPNSFLTALSGADYARHVVDGAKVIKDYIFGETKTK